MKVLWSRYQKEGISGLQKRPNIKADYALKRDIVLDIEENHLTLHEASLKYGANPQKIGVFKEIMRTRLKAKRKKRHYNSYKGQTGKVAPNVINRNFSAERPNQKWTTDVSQVCIKDEKLYISPKLDMYNGEIIVYTLSRSPNLRMVTDMLKKVFKYRKPEGAVAALRSGVALSVYTISKDAEE